MNTESIATRRKAWFLLGIMLCAALSVTLMPRRLAADDAKPAAAAADAQDVKKEVPAENFLAWVMRCSGLIGFVILLLSIYFVSTVGQLFWEMRIEKAAPRDIVLQSESLLEQRDFKGIYSLVRDDSSFFSRLLTTGISELPNGLADARESMERVGEAITAEMEKKISMLAVLGTLGPMIGLLGTLKGMISSFSGIAMGGSQVDTARVATGISEALLITFEGVLLSVPSIYFYALFRNRIIHISTSVSLTADQFLRHFSHAGRAKASPSVPPARPAN